MRIISKERDYYDGLADYQTKDRLNRVWVRNEKDVIVHRSKLKYLEERARWVRDNNLFPNYLIIAGKVFPFLQNVIYEYQAETRKFITKDNPSDVQQFSYTMNSVLEKRQQFFRKHYNRKERESFFNEYPDMTDLNLELGSPIILVKPEVYSYSVGVDREYARVWIDVNLKELDFSKVMDSPSVYQLLDHFVSNIMINDDMPKGLQTDIEKVEAHGFDKVKSFRNMK